jgi:cob(I)alamin adenosyltransferase
MKIYTKTGDGGETGLFGGPRVRKDHPRIAAYGDVDELNASLAGIRAAQPPQEIEHVLERIQHELFAVGAELATPDPEAHGTRWISTKHTRQLEADIDHWEGSLPPLRTFVLPGGSPASAAIHLARCICRRAERQIVALAAIEPISNEIVIYVNRLSDLLFVMARVANQHLGVADVPWCKPSE